MKRMKTFIKYLIAFLIVYALVDFFSYMTIKSTYLTKDCKVDFETPQIENLETKCTATNGYVSGRLVNTTGNTLTNKFLKIDCFSKRGVNLGTKYVKLNELAAEASQEFESKFNYDGVENIAMSLVDGTAIENASLEDFQLDDLAKNKTNWLIVLAALLMIYG